MPIYGSRPSAFGVAILPERPAAAISLYWCWGLTVKCLGCGCHPNTIQLKQRLLILLATQRFSANLVGRKRKYSEIWMFDFTQFSQIPEHGILLELIMSVSVTYFICNR